MDTRRVLCTTTDANGDDEEGIAVGPHDRDNTPQLYLRSGCYLPRCELVVTYRDASSTICNMIHSSIYTGGVQIRAHTTVRVYEQPLEENKMGAISGFDVEPLCWLHLCYLPRVRGNPNLVQRKNLLEYKLTMALRAEILNCLMI